MCKTLTAIIVFLTTITSISANDGVYFTSGNFLVPTQETDISVTKEILTITIGKDSFARVDIYYELFNNSQSKTINMAFEAASTYNDYSPINTRGVHPHIRDFTVSMNDTAMEYSNAVVAIKYKEGMGYTDFKPLDMTKWKGYGEAPDSIVPIDDILYNAELDSIIDYGYAYFFKARFRRGKNIVHHTYKYRMSYNVAQRFEIPYWLTPATRWANRQVDDFTLNITADEMTDFCMPDSLFRNSPFVSNKGERIFHLTSDYGESMIFTTANAGDTISWHCNNFKPTAEMCISSPIWDRQNVVNRMQTSAKVVVEDNGNIYRYIADCGDCYFVDAQDYGLVKKSQAHIEDYSAEAGQGCLTINTEMANRVNIRSYPTTNSKIIATISDMPGDLPETFDCLGLVNSTDKEFGYQWYKVSIDGKTGYIRQDLMLWDAINTY